MWRGQPGNPPWIAHRRPQTQHQPARCWSGGGNLPAAPEAARTGAIRVACDLHHSLFDKEGERDFSVAGSDLLLEIERRHELAEHRGLADRLQTTATNRDEDPFLDQIEHIQPAPPTCVPVLGTGHVGVGGTDDPPAPADRPNRSRPRSRIRTMRFCQVSTPAHSKALIASATVARLHSA